MSAKDKHQPDYAGLQAVNGVDRQNYPQVVSYQGGYQDHHLSTASDNQSRRVCGLKKTTFWIVFAVTSVLIFTAVIGGVLGGVLPKALKDKK
jgi:hypothetical protein